MKLRNMFLLLIGIQACLLIYADPTVHNTVLWGFISNMQNWSSTEFVLAIVGIAGSIALAGVVVGNLFGFKTDFLMFAPAIAGFISIGVVFSQLGSVIQDELTQRIFYTACQTNALCLPATFFATIIVGPFAFLYFWSVVTWWRGGGAE